MQSLSRYLFISLNQHPTLPSEWWAHRSALARQSLSLRACAGSVPNFIARPDFYRAGNKVGTCLSHPPKPFLSSTQSCRDTLACACCRPSPPRAPPGSNVDAGPTLGADVPQFMTTPTGGNIATRGSGGSRGSSGGRARSSACGQWLPEAADPRAPFLAHACWCCPTAA